MPKGHASDWATAPGLDVLGELYKFSKLEDEFDKLDELKGEFDELLSCRVSLVSCRMS